MNNIHIFRTPWLKLVMCTLISLLCLNVSQAWATDQTVTLTFEGTGSYPNNSNWTCDGSGSSSYNHTASGSKCASLATTGPAYFTYANSLSNVKSVTLYFLRHSNSTKKPTFVVQGRAKTTDDWVDKKSSGAVDVGSKDSWKEVTITLDAAYSGYIRVKYTCESDAGRWIDDITITYTPASCDESPTIGNAQINTASNNGAFNWDVSPKTFPVKITTMEAGDGCSISEYGFVWQSGGSDPTISNNKTKIGESSSATSFSGNISGSFALGTTYKVKGYVTNDGGNTTLSTGTLTIIPRSVTFNKNGHGSESAPATQYVADGQKAASVSDLTDDGYTFGGWYTNADWTQGTQWNFASSTVTGDNVTLYAKWTAKATLSSIAITTPPTTTGYLVGETFGSAGAVVTATYSDATTANVTASTTWTPTTGLTEGSNTITASYTEGGVTKTATTTVTAYTVTVNKVDEDGTAIADAGVTASCTGRTLSQSVGSTNYVFKEWQLTTASGTSISTNSITGTPTGNVEVSAVFYKPITITYKANSQNFTTQTYAYGGTLAFPASNPDGATYSCDGKTFVGWVGEANKDYSHASIAPTYATAGGSVTAAATYYAVFATSAGELSNSYAAITSGIETANYVIAYSYNGGTQIVLKNAADNSSPLDKLEGYNLSLSASKYSNPGASYIWELQAQPDGSYYIYNANVNKYVNATTSALTLSTTPTKFTISYDGSNSRWTIQIKDNTSYYIHRYVDGSNYDFRVSTSGGGNKYRIYLYKQESNITYSAYATTCSTEPRLNVTPTSLAFGSVPTNETKDLTFTLSGINLTANASISITGTNSSYFTASTYEVAKVGTTISATVITVTYDPGAAGSHSATLTVSSTGAESQTVSLIGTGAAPQYTLTLTANPVAGGEASAVATKLVNGGTTTITATPNSHYTFNSWTIVSGTGASVTSTTTNPTTFTMGSTAAEVRANFDAEAKIAVTWKANGTTLTGVALGSATTEVFSGDKVTACPPDPSDLSGDCTAEFVGWAPESSDPHALSISTTTSTGAITGFFTSSTIASSPTITSAITFIAIYRQEQ